MTNLRSLSDLFKAAGKLAAACAVVAAAASFAAGQTNTFPSSGNAGIGTTSPNTKLEVVGNDSDQLRLTRASAPTTQYTTLGTHGADFLIKGVNTLSANHVQFRWQSQNNSTTVDRMIIDQSGNVGIGTTAPASALHIYGTTNTRKGINIDAHGTGWAQQAELNFFTLGDGTKDVLTAGTKGWHLTARGNAYIGTAEQNDLQLYRWDGASLPIVQYWDYATGNVGIGTTSPAYKLDVNGEINATGIRINGTPISGGGSSQWTGTSAIYYNSGNVGIGTSSPSDLLELNSSTGWAFRVRYAGDGQYLRVSANQLSAFTAAGTPKDLYLNVDGGNVGIGTSSPLTEKLHVAGDGKFTGNLKVAGTIEGGNIKAKYQDLAEWVPSSEQLSAGTVVVLDITKSNQVISSTLAYDTRVAGVISAQPGITLGESGEGKVLVATTGRVRVKADASRGAIQIGDLLVTSDVSGLAMKSEPVEFAGRKMHMPGTIIGKALEPLAKGSGEILVLLSPQ